MSCSPWTSSVGTLIDAVTEEGERVASSRSVRSLMVPVVATSVHARQTSSVKRPHTEPRSVSRWAAIGSTRSRADASESRPME